MRLRRRDGERSRSQKGHLWGPPRGSHGASPKRARFRAFDTAETFRDVYIISRICSGSAENFAYYPPMRKGFERKSAHISCAR